jgi:tRNA(Ile)-lysidine synthase
MRQKKLYNFEKSLLENLSKIKSINDNKNIIIAISGGKDSMALLYGMMKLNHILKLNLIAVHVNHHIRKNSISDELFVKEFCNTNDIKIIIDHLDLKTKLKDMSIEEWAREYRYKSLYRISSNYNSCHIMTAHHGNDQIETILFHLSQGTGIAGLRGIHSERDRLIRPLLSLSKNNINDYIKDRSIPWFDDPSNNDLSIPRNFLRHTIVLPWENKNSSLVSSFNQITKNANDVYESLKFSAGILIPQLICNKENDQIHLDEQLLKAIPPYLLSIIFQELTLLNGPWRRHAHYELYKFVADSKIGQIYKLQNKWRLLKDRNKFILKNEISIEAESFTILPDTEICIEDYIFSWKSCVEKEKYNSSKTSEIVDVDKIRNKNLTLRLWKKGDRFRPLGMKGSKKLSDFFIDEKIDIFSKNKQWVLLDGKRIIWVCGRRISDDVKVTSKTTKLGKFIFRK